MVIQESGRADRDGGDLCGHSPPNEPTAGGRRSPAIVLHEDEAKGFVGVGYSRHAVVVELSQHVAVSLHLPHSGSSDTEYMEACLEASR